MVIFFYGEDSFRAGQKIREIKNKFLHTDKSASGLSVFDYADKERKNSPLDVLGIANLLAPKRLVIIKNLISAGAENEQEEVLKYLQKNSSTENETDLVIVFWEKGKLKKSHKLFKFLEKNSKKQEFEKLSGAKLSNWMIQRLKEIDEQAQISKTALEKLATFVGGDSGALDKEIQKLANFAAGRMIKDTDIDELVRAQVDNNIFATIDALSFNRKKEALQLLHQHLEKGDDPFYLLSMFVYQFRNLLKVVDLKENQGLGEYEIAKVAKLHPFVVKKGLAQGRNFSLAKLKEIYQKLFELDVAVKTGKMEIKLGLDKFIVEL